MAPPYRSWLNNRLDREQWGLFLTPVLVAVIMLLIEYFGIQSAFYERFAGLGIFRDLDARQLQFAAQVHMSAACLLLFVVLPLGFHFAFPVTPHHCYYGLSLTSVFRHAPLYLALLLLMLPVLWLVSLDPGFNRFYPLYDPRSGGDWIRYEMVYMLQFVALEYFFRGFMLFRLEKYAGFHAIALMVIPYSLLHIHKPFPEAMASIVAGIVLGYLALKTRSIWPGVIVHCGVALSMDVFAMINSGRIGLLS